MTLSWFDLQDQMAQAEQGLLTHDRNLEHSGENITPSVVLEQIYEFLRDETSMRSTWKRIAGMRGISSQGAHAEAFSLLMGHHVIANFQAAVRTSLPRSTEFGRDFTIDSEQYQKAVVSPLLSVLSAAETFSPAPSTSRSDANAASNLVASFPLQGKLALVRELAAAAAAHAGADNEVAKVCTTLSPSLCLELTEMMLRTMHKFRPRNAEVAASSDSAAVPIMVISILTRQPSLLEDLVHLVFLRATYSTSTARMLVKAICKACNSAPNHLLAASTYVCRVWGSPHFAARSEIRRHEYVSAALGELLEALRESQKALHGDEQEAAASATANLLGATGSVAGVTSPSLATLLSTGVSAFLECNDSRSQNCGIGIARCFSAMMGLEDAFAKVDDTDSISNSSIDSGATAAAGGGGPTADASVDGGSESDSDSDSDLEAYDLTPPPALQGAAVYLRACLDIILVQDAQQSNTVSNNAGASSNGDGSNIADKQEAALRHIPRLLRGGASDGQTLTAALTRALLSLANPYNIESFNQLRSAAMLACIELYPLQSLPVLAKAICSDEVVLGTRIWAVSQIGAAAHVIANIPIPGGMLTTEKGGMVSKAQHTRVDRLGKTSIKRPLTLAARKRDAQTRTVRRSAFGSISLLFAGPLVSVVMAPLSSDIHSDQQHLQEEQHLLRGSADRIAAVQSPEALLAHLAIERLENKAVDSENTTSTVGIPNSGKDPVQDLDELQGLLISEALLSLAAVTRCAHNTTQQRVLLTHTLKAAAMWLSSPQVAVRRAAFGAGVTAIAAWKLQREESSTGTRWDSNGGSALETLADLSGRRTESQRSKPFLALADQQLGPLLAKLVDGALNGLKSEADDLCRALRADLGRAALSLDENTEDDDDISDAFFA